MRAARFLRRGFCLLQQRRNQLQAGPGQPSSVKEYDAERFGGWKSAEILFGDKAPRQSVIGRADWHVVQFLIAMLPPGLVLLLVQWARYDMRRLEEEKKQEMLEKESRKLQAVAEHQQKQAEQAQQAKPPPQQQAGKASAPSSSSSGGGGGSPAAVPAATATGATAAAAAGEDAVEQRLARLEALVRAMQQMRQGSAGQAPREQAAAAEAEQQAAQEAVGQPAGAGLGQGGHQAAAAEEQQEAAAQPGPSAAQRLADALRWAGSWVAFGRQPSPAETGSGGEAGTPSATSKLAADSEDRSNSGRLSRSSDGSSVSSEDGSSSSSSSQGAAAFPVAKAAVADAAIAPDVAAATQAAPPAARQPGNAANWLLHAAGQPLRWLRSKPRPAETEGAEEEQRLRRWLQQKPEESE